MRLSSLDLNCAPTFLEEHRNERSRYADRCHVGECLVHQFDELNTQFSMEALGFRAATGR